MVKTGEEPRFALVTRTVRVTLPTSVTDEVAERLLPRVRELVLEAEELLRSRVQLLCTAVNRDLQLETADWELGG